MSGAYVAMMVFFAVMAANAGRRDGTPVDDATRAERLRKLRALAVILGSLLALFYAAIFAFGSIGIFFALAFGNEPWSIGTFLLVPTLAATSVVLGWVGLRFLRDKDLPGRLARACAAAYEAFFEPIPEGAKPKPARGEHDLD